MNIAFDQTAGHRRLATSRNTFRFLAFAGVCLTGTAMPDDAYSQTTRKPQASSSRRTTNAEPTQKQVASRLQEEKLALEVNKLRIENANAERSSRLQEEKNALEVNKLRIENANNERSFASTLGWQNLVYENVPVIVAIVLGFVGLFRYLRERREELLKREDERFEGVVKGMGSAQEAQRVSSAVLLSTFLRPGFERFYVQVFNLAAGNLRYADTSASVSSTSHPLVQALASVLRESYSLARDSLKARDESGIDLLTGRYLNATGISLNGAFLAGADLEGGWLREATFRGARLRGVKLASAILEKADFSGAELVEIVLYKANLKEADFTEANVEYGDLSDARVDRAIFRDANLSNVTMTGGTAGGVDFSGADLTGAKLRGVDFTPIPPNVKEANPEAANILSNALFENVTGLTEAQIARCKEKGAKFT